MSTETQSTESPRTGTVTAAPDGPVAPQVSSEPWAPAAEQPVHLQEPLDGRSSLTPPPQAYGYPAASAPAYPAAPTPGLSIASLVLGVSSIFLGVILVAPIAGLVLGILGLRREPQGRTMAIWGIVLNAVTLAGSAVVAFLILVFALGAPLFALADPSNF